MKLPTLEQLRRAGVVAALDEHFARCLGRIGGETRETALVAAALAARRVSESHVCLDLAEIAGAEPRADVAVSGGAETPDLSDHAFPPLADWLADLEQSPLVRGLGGPAPLVLDGHRLYLRRYHDYEIELARRVRERAERRCADVDLARLRDGLQRLFPGGPRPSWQRIAAAVAFLRRFTVIAGGPGTGKTWTAARIVALLAEQGLERFGRAPHIQLLAPTGKAAARLRESLRDSRASLPCEPAVRAAMPDDASTIHRALGATPDGRFRRSADSRLVADAVIVDEASMVDLALMSRLVAAIPDHARLILLGDRDQLASVQAGSVLADLCGESGGPTSSFSPDAAREIAALTGDEVPVARAGGPPVRDCIVTLSESRRFGEQAGIVALTRAIQEARVSDVIEVLRSPSHGDAVLVEPTGDLDERVAELATAGYASSFRAPDPHVRLAALARFRVLCAHRRGPDGVEPINAVIERALAERHRLTVSEPYYVGRPLLVTRNDPSTRLSNGDVGLVVRTPDGSKKALFPGEDVAGEGAARSRLISTARLPAVETAFAITVHKSQGSEFEDVVVVLPDKPSPVVTRELLYTAVTRARRSVTLLAPAAVVEHAVRTPTRRITGLRERIWGV